MKKVIVFFDDSRTLEANHKLYFDYIGNESGIYLYAKSSKKMKLVFLISPERTVRDIEETFYGYIRVEEGIFEVDKDFPIFTNADKAQEVILKMSSTIHRLVKKARYWEKTVDEQNIFIERLLLTVTKQHKDGISHGYLSYYSNYVYYLSQVKSVSNKEQYKTIERKIKVLSPRESEEISSELIVFEELSSVLQELSRSMLNNLDIISQGVLPSPNNFFDNSLVKIDYSDFHKEVFSNEILIKRYMRKSFIVYRVLMVILFSLLPTLSIDLNRRNHILYLLVSHVEFYYGTDWRKQINESLELEKEYVVEKY